MDACFPPHLTLLCLRNQVLTANFSSKFARVYDRTKRHFEQHSVVHGTHRVCSRSGLRRQIPMQDDLGRSALLRIPPEIRQLIYEQVWPSNACRGDVVPITDTGPGIGLLLTCRRLYNEAKKHFVNAQRAHEAQARYSLEAGGTLIFVPADDSEDTDSSDDCTGRWL